MTQLPTPAAKPAHLRLALAALALGAAALASGCIDAPRRAIIMQEPAPVATAKRITPDGAGNLLLPDGTRVAVDQTGGFTLPNGAYVSRDRAGGLNLPNGTRCAPDGRGGYVCP